MSKHKHSNYSNMYQSQQHDVNDIEEIIEETTASNVFVPEVKMEPEVVAEVSSDSVVETVETPEVSDVPPIPTVGTVVDCSKLNIRQTPSLTAKILTVINVGDTVEITESKSTDEWYHVCTSTGVVGYARREFVMA